MILCELYFGLDFVGRPEHIVQCVIEGIADAFDGVTHFLGVSSLDLGHAFGHGPFFWAMPRPPGKMPPEPPAAG